MFHILAGFGQVSSEVWIGVPFCGLSVGFITDFYFIAMIVWRGESFATLYFLFYHIMTNCAKKCCER